MKKQKNIINSKITCIDLIPIFLIIGILPIITIPHLGLNSYRDYPWCNIESLWDVFLWGKGIVLIVITLFAIALMTWKAYKKKWYVSMNNQFYWLIGYAGLAFFSALFSKYKTVSWFGATEQYESFLVVLCYVLICIFSYYVGWLYCNQNSSTKISKLTSVFPLLLIPTMILCVGQFFHFDILNILLKGRGFDFAFPAGTVYGSFYNPNFVGSYVVLLLPILLLYVIGTSKAMPKIIAIVLTVALFITLIGSHSTSGYMILIFVGIIGGLLQIRDKKSCMIVIAAILGLSVLFVLVDTVNEHYYSDKIWDTLHPDTATSSLSQIETNDDNIVITYKDNDLKISFTYNETDSNPYTFTIADDADQTVNGSVNEEDGHITLTDERFQGFEIYPAYLSNVDNLLTFCVVIDGKNWFFTNQTDGTYYYVNNLGNLDKIDNAPIALFEGNPNFASGRGFLWGKTIPLLKKYILFGSGPDTYAFVYPQSDYVGKYNNSYEGTYVTRPHNMYLQSWVQTGLFSLLCQLVFYGIYFVQSIRIYHRKHQNSLGWYIGYGIFLGTLGYMLIGMFNDSSITVAPLYWVLLGCGIALNQYVQKEDIV